MKITIATDAWRPQVNGVVRTLSETIDRLVARGFDVDIITPERFITVACPGYREIRLAVAPRFGARRALHANAPDVVHIATEGPIGWSVRSWCLAHNIPFTTAFHTRFPDYLAVRTGLSAERFWPIMKKFHLSSRAVLTATGGLIAELATRGITNTRLWSRGIDHELFNVDQPNHPLLKDLPRPIMISVGRVSVEKNLEAFLSAQVCGSKVIVGDGPAFIDLKNRYPDAVFLGKLEGLELASAYATADVFVFPSITDTFGLVMIEAMASGLPVAAFPVSGPLDVIGSTGHGIHSNLSRPIGFLDNDLSIAIERALSVRKADAAAYAKGFDWDRCTDQFVDALRKASTNLADPRMIASC